MVKSSKSKLLDFTEAMICCLSAVKICLQPLSVASISQPLTAELPATVNKLMGDAGVVTVISAGSQSLVLLILYVLVAANPPLNTESVCHVIPPSAEYCVPL